LRKKVSYTVKNITDEDFNFTITLMDKSVVSDVFHAQEIVVGLSKSAMQMFKQFDSCGEIFQIKEVEEIVRSEWMKEGF